MKLIDIDKLKKFFIEDPKMEATDIQEALARYCSACKKGFKDPRSKGAHVRAAHENVFKR